MCKTFFLVINEDCMPELYPAQQCKCEKPVKPEPPIATFPTGIVRTNGSNLNLRKQPSLDAEVIARMPNGSQISIIDQDTSNWYKVLFQNMSGYAASEWIEMQ